MPYHRRRRFRRKRHRPSGLATRPRLMTHYNKMRRWNNVSTKIFYLKESGQLETDLAGNISVVFSVRDLPQVTAQFLSCAQLYDQYKVLAMNVRFFPANVGIEPHDALVTQDFTLFRGNCVVWSDQRPGDATPIPTSINQIINYGSARMIQPRRFYKRTIYRAKGYPTWGGIDATQTQDPWRGTISLLQTDATPQAAGGTPPVLWYYSRTFKVLFRGRKQS